MTTAHTEKRDPAHGRPWLRKCRFRFWAIIVRKPEMDLIGTGATRQQLAREVGGVTSAAFEITGDVRYNVPGFVGNGAAIARIMGVRPM